MDTLIDYLPLALVYNQNDLFAKDEKDEQWQRLKALV